MNLGRIIAAAFILIASAPAQPPSSLANAARCYVNPACTGSKHDGKSWSTGFTTIQEAIASGAGEVWVAKGTYSLGSQRNSTFQLRKGCALFGGFAGDEPQRDQRDWQKNKTVLNGNGAYHVVTGADDAVLDGFTVTGGNGLGGEGSGPPPGAGGKGSAIHMTPEGILAGANSGSGAGMLNFQAAPTIRNCIFENNQAGKGGAVYNMTSKVFPPRPDAGNKNPVFINCVFRKNSARGRGGGVSNDLGTSPTCFNCVFEENETPQKGGGMYNDFGCSPVLINCLFVGNRAQSAGGMGNDGGSSPVLLYCTFTKNHAVDYGAPLYQGTGPSSNPALIDCVITANTCDWDEPGIYNWHDNTPLIKQTSSTDLGYKAGRFKESELPHLLALATQYQANPVMDPPRAPQSATPSSGRVIYVNASRTERGNGRAWDSAYASLQEALADAGKDGAEVRVAAGVYKLGADRSKPFAMQPGVRVYGGFKGAECDPGKNPTVLDGNHAFHVVAGANGALLDGFTITGGCADGAGYDGKGGGLINYQRGPQSRPNSPTITGYSMTVSHCAFTKNYAREGGAVYGYDRGKTAFDSCVFSGNRAENGGALLERVGVESTFTNCEFAGNTGHWRGGALYFDYGCRPKLRGCVFRNNATEGHGGGVFSVSRASQLENTMVTLVDCRFEGNSARGNGGAAAFCDSSLSCLENCKFEGNKAGKQGADVFKEASSAGRP